MPKGMPFKRLLIAAGVILVLALLMGGGYYGKVKPLIRAMQDVQRQREDALNAGYQEKMAAYEARIKALQAKMGRKSAPPKGQDETKARFTALGYKPI